MPFNDTTPTLEMLADGQWRLSQALVYTSPKGLKVCVPTGFITDLASVPRAFWNLYPPFGSYAPAAIIHDYLYTCQEIGGDPFQEPPIFGQPISRSEADKLLLQAMDDLGVNETTCNIIYMAVRVFGGPAWREL